MMKRRKAMTIVATLTDNNALRDWEIENDQQRLSKRVAKREEDNE